VNIISNLRKTATITAVTAVVSSMAITGIAQAQATTSPKTSNTGTSSGLTTAQQQDLNNIISKGNQEIIRRLTSLGTLSGKISGTTKLSASDQAYLVSEVNTEITGLTNLKTQLDADTTLAAARSDAQSIFTEYRVYALVLPKVWLVSTADAQQVVEGKLTTLAQKLQTRITSEQTAGKNIANLQTDLNDMTTKTNNAQSISSSIEQTVLTLQPSDYDSNHTVLSGDNSQLQTAHSDDVAAYNDAQTIVTALKNL
jgi:hypothetical protein